MFFTFHQNNSNGVYLGPRSVIIEADTATEANRYAELVGIYFGFRELDCYCCGFRWYPQGLQEQGETWPNVFGNPPECSVMICYKDGTVIHIP